MKCPYRKQTETVDGTTSEYYMECYGTECPNYEKYISSFDEKEVEECKKVTGEYYHATHLGGT